MNILSKNDDCEFANFFKKLGYDYSWDFSQHDGLYWHELYKGKKLCLQADMHHSLEEILAEINYDGPDRTPKFFIASSEPEWSELQAAVRALNKEIDFR